MTGLLHSVVAPQVPSIENAVPDGDLTGLTDWAYRVQPRTIGVTLRAKY